MANKKTLDRVFPIRGKRSVRLSEERRQAGSAPRRPGAAAAADPQKNGGAGKAARRAEIMEGGLRQYPAEKLGIPRVGARRERGTQRGCLSLSGISTAGDLVSRTERDMFKVQGFNKKMLLALKRGLEKEGMAFYTEAPREQARPEPPRERERKTGAASAESEAPQSVRKRSARRDRKNSPSPFLCPSGERSKRTENGVFMTVSTPSSPRCTTKCSFSRTVSPLWNSTRSAAISTLRTTSSHPFEYETAMSFSEGYLQAW